MSVGHHAQTQLSVDDILRAAGSLHEGDIKQILADTYAVFPGHTGCRQKKVEILSDGQQQKVALGHAVMSRPKYMLLDEISLGLAPLAVKRLMDVVKSLADQGIGIILIEQFSDLVQRIADYACVLGGGKLHFAGSPSLLKSQPEVLKEAYFGG